MVPRTDASAPTRSSKMLFLASHGFQTPISAIRWGSGRLKKMLDDLKPVERALLDGIQQQAKLLSEMFDALLLLAKVEDGIHESRLQDIYLKDYFEERLKQLPPEIVFELSCPDDARLRVDRTAFESVTQALLNVIASAGGGSRPLMVDVVMAPEERRCDMTFRAPLSFSLIEPDAALTTPADPKRIVGGVPGLMLAVASSLVSFLGGDLGAEQGNLGTITLRLPAPDSVSVLP